MWVHPGGVNEGDITANCMCWGNNTTSTSGLSPTNAFVTETVTIAILLLLRRPPSSYFSIILHLTWDRTMEGLVILCVLWATSAHCPFNSMYLLPLCRSHHHHHGSSYPSKEPRGSKHCRTIKQTGESRPISIFIALLILTYRLYRSGLLHLPSSHSKNLHRRSIVPRRKQRESWCLSMRKGVARSGKSGVRIMQSLSIYCQGLVEQPWPRMKKRPGCGR